MSFSTPESNHNNIPNPEQSQAHNLLAFVLDAEDIGRNPDTSGVCASTVQDALTELRTSPERSEHSSLSWKFVDGNQYAGPHYSGVSYNFLPDNSVTVTYITQAMPSLDTQQPSQNLLRISILAHDKDQPQKAAQVCYTIANGSAEIRCTVDRLFGLRMTGLFDIVDRLEGELEEKGIDRETGLITAIGAVLLEDSMLKDGITPSADPELTELRDESNTYTELSNTLRKAAHDEQLARQLGLNSEYIVGEEDIRGLIEFLKGL